jgi:threonine/homoserine efflux transporter RhtA
MGVTGALLVFVGLVLLADLALTPQQRDNVIGTWVALTVYQVVWLAVPVSVGASILRYRLYDIDVLINRALVYGSLTASIAIVYIGAVIGLQALVQVITGHHSDLTIAVATLAVAALFNPWRHRLQRFVDRRFYRRKYDASRTLAAFSAQIRDEVDLDRLSRNLLGAVEQTVQPANIAIWLPREGETA